MKKEVMSLLAELKDYNLTDDVIKRVNKLFFSFATSVEEPVDLVLVLSSSALKRMEKATELYFQYNCPILISGSNVVLKDGLLEDERYFIYATCHGVPSSKIIFERKSKNTLENLTYSLEKLKNMPYRKIALVTSSQHMLRVLLTLKKLQPDQNLAFFPCVCYPSAVLKDNWMKEKKTINIIIGELERLLLYNLI